MGYALCRLKINIGTLCVKFEYITYLFNFQRVFISYFFALLVNTSVYGPDCIYMYSI